MRLFRLLALAAVAFIARRFFHHHAARIGRWTRNAPGALMSRRRQVAARIDPHHSIAADRRTFTTERAGAAGEFSPGHVAPEVWTDDRDVAPPVAMDQFDQQFPRVEASPSERSDG